MPHDQLAYPLDLAEMTEWIVGATPRGARLLEIGSGDGVLTERLAAAGIDVLGIDPNATESEHVRVVGVEDLEAEPFDMVFASVSLHHVPDPPRTVDALRRLTKPGSLFLVREFDRVLVDDERTLRWWYHQRRAHEAACELDSEERHVPDSFEEFVETWRTEMEHHVLPWSTVRDTLRGAGFATEHEESTTYLYRWGLSEPVRPLEEDLVVRGYINRVGIRWTGRRT